MENFEEILALDPSYEPAKLFLESAVIRIEIINEQQEINNIKLKMADILVEYDKRREAVDTLAIKYFLNQAEEHVQAGNYDEADKLYGVCYKINPNSENKIEWFVKATHDLKKLALSLDEHYKKIEELTSFE